MPRTKQVHPRNLRDKIEEAQKELNGAEVSKKEILEASIKGTSESLKGVKRKKIVTENHLKKIPKSPLRNPLQAKHKQNSEGPSFTGLQSASESHKKPNHIPIKNGKQFTKQNGETPGITAEASKPEDSASPKKPLFLQQHASELRRWRSEGSESTKLNFLDGKCDSSSLRSKTRADNSECVSSNCSTTSSSYTNTAFDVLLKAMEPELSTLSQKGSSCAIKIEKLRPNKTVRSPSKLKNSSVDVPSQTSQECVAQSRSSPCTSYPVHAPATQQNEQAAAQPVPHSFRQHEHFVCNSEQHNNPPLPGCSGFTRSLNLQNQEHTKLEHVYNIAVTSSIVLTSPSSRTQVIPQNQPSDSTSPMSVGPANSTQPPTTPLYNSTPVASVVNHSVEQMCNLLLKDQKPKKQGKYICEYCNRACAKPSVLLKHIRSHTGERPYPCVTCGFSFKTKSNLYKHKKSHAHTIKLGLVLQPDPAGVFSSESPKALSVHSDVEDSGESEDEGPNDERHNDPGSTELQSMQIMKTISNAEALPKLGFIPGNPDHVVGDFSLQEKSSDSQAVTELPKVVVHPVTVSPLRTDGAKRTQSVPELSNTQKQRDLQLTSVLSNSACVSSLETDEKSHQKGEMSPAEGKQESHAVHAQLQRQQATDYSQEQQGKLLLSPRSLGSTDSGYFSRSESAEQTASPPASFARTLTTTEQSSNTKSNGPSAALSHTQVSPAVPTGEKGLFLPGQMRPPLATKTLEERISKLISDNEALVDDKQLDSVKPRRTSLSRRGSIDSPKSYIFKDSFQFDLKPMGRRTSSSSDIPKSPFTPTEKSKQVFLLSVPSLDCLPITRSNSMPTTGYSAVPANIIPPPHPLRGTQSFDDKIGTFYDDVFVSGPNPSAPQSGHPRTLVRQAAIEDSSANENHVLGAGQPSDESSQGCGASSEMVSARNRSSAQGPTSDKKKSHHGRGTMFECETCRNRYRKLENFENHKKFYCSELHGPKTKVAVREAEHNSPVPSGTQPQILHYRVAGSTGVWEQTPQIRKRRKMKSVGDDDELQQNESGASPKSSEGLQFQNTLGCASSLSKHNAITGDQQPRSIQLQNSQVQLVARGTDPTIDPKLSTIMEQQISTAAQDKTELKRHGTGISVIQHTNSLSRPSSFEKLESLEKGSPVSLQELSRTVKPGTLKVLGISPEENHPSRSLSYPHQPALSDTLRGQLQKSSRKIPSERNVLGQPSRLVRQHNIQVPEILVTEEPDRDLEVQGHDQEKSEKFSWPQRSETLSKLPTEKLPPKKKRLRLAEIEHSSTESSFDSTLSRSLSRESSLSHTSSFSASLDIEDPSKTEASPKIDFLNKAEFLVIPAGSNTLSIPGTYREMRRAASEQINCMQTSMEVSDFRSKSFDCGSITPSQMTPPVELQPPTSPSGMAVTGHVPLLERRRGPLIRQISLNIAPDSLLPPLNPSTFQNIAPPGVNPVPFQGPQTAPTSLAEFPTNTSHSQIQVKDLRTEMSNSSSTNIFPVQQLFGTNLLNQVHTSTNHQLTLTTPEVATQCDNPDPSPPLCASSENEDCFAPKYQLQFQVLTSSQSCSSNPVHSLPSHVLSDPVGADHCTTSLALPTTSVDAMSNSCSLPALQPRPHGSQGPQVSSSFMVPVRLQSNVPAYCFATVTSLPQILVTQDLPNQSVFQANDTLVPVSEEQHSVPKSLKDHQSALPNPEKGLLCENVFSEMGQHSLLGSLPVTQKMSVGRLSPQQESAASSKRMLSPANSLDIAMEKHQKRAKDENGAVCTTDIRSLEPLGSRANEANKQKKPVLVRQVCTAESLDGVILEQDVFSQPEVSSEVIHLTAVLPTDNSSSGHSKSGVKEAVSELQEFENLRSSASLTFTARNSPIPSENTGISPLQSIDNDQERKSLVGEEPGGRVNAQVQSELATALSASAAGDPQQPSFPSLKTTTSFTWCYLLKQKSLHLPQDDRKTSAYTDWTVSSSNPNPLGLPTKVALSLLNSKQKTEKSLYCQAITTHSKSDVLVYSSKWKNNLSKRALGNQKSTVGEFSNKDASEINSEQDKENSLIKSEPRRIKIFDGGYKSNEEYVYVRGRGRGKYICEECGIRCKKPSMLKKHIRTHTDVRPYHCSYCNFSFKTKGNLTKHMKSKAHSKKCVDLGVSVGLIDEHDTEESDEKQRFGCERSGYDIEESDGPDEDENENEDDDEDSQAESVLSAAPSVTASPQHLPSRTGLQDATSAEEEFRTGDSFSTVHPDPMDILPRALLTKMTVLSTAHPNCSRKTGSPEKATQPAAPEKTITHVDFSTLPEATPRSPWRQMSVDYPESDEILSHSVGVTAFALAQNTSSVRQPPAAEPGTPQPAVGNPSGASPGPSTQEQKQQATVQPTTGLPSPQTHLFSHLPLHSQQQSRTPYNMVPVGGIQVVPAGLTYSTLVPIQAGPMQLTIPAVGVIHRTVGTPGDTVAEVSSTTDPAVVAEVSSVVPCIPIGQVRVPGLQNVCTPGLQPLPSLSVDTVNILGLANANMTPQGHPPGLALNAVGLQVLTADPASQSSPSPQAHIPSLQIVNIALPALIPSVGQAPLDAPRALEMAASQSKAPRETQPRPAPGASARQVDRTESPQGSPRIQRGNAKKLPEPPAPTDDPAWLDGPKETAPDKAAADSHVTLKPEVASAQGRAGLVSESLPRACAEPSSLSPDPRGSPRRQNARQFSDASSDDDEDRLVIAT